MPRTFSQRSETGDCKRGQHRMYLSIQRQRERVKRLDRLRRKTSHSQFELRRELTRAMDSAKERLEEYKDRS